MDRLRLSGRKRFLGKTEITREDFHRLYPRLVALFRRKDVSTEDARDLAQETLLQAQKNLANFQGRSAFDTWMVSIAKNIWLHRCRNQGRMKRNSEEFPLEALSAKPQQLPSVKSHEGHAINRERLARARNSISSLPEAMKQALMLHIEGYKYRQIATLLGVTVNQVSSLIHQARAKLRREICEQSADSAS